MYKSIDEFINDWQFEAEKTITIFESLTDDALEKRVWSKGRTMCFIAWHIVLTINEMISETGLKIESNANEEKKLSESVSEIIKWYKQYSNAMVEAIKKNWTDEDLTKEINLYGQKWTISMILVSLIRHQIHHRGQITVLMRQAGLAVPGIYGPSQEEWEKLGMPTQK